MLQERYVASVARMDDEETIETSLVRTIATSDLAELTSDFADAALDDLPIPVFSSLRKLYRGARSVQNYFYVKKVIQYLRELRDLSADTRREQLAELLPTPDEREKFGEHISLVLDRVNDVSKARLMGRASLAFLNGNIDFEQLKSLNFAIDSIDLRLLPFLKAPYTATESDKQSLASCGLMILKLDIRTESIGIADLHSSGQSIDLLKSASVQYSLTDLATLFIDICLD